MEQKMGLSEFIVFYGLYGVFGLVGIGGAIALLRLLFRVRKWPRRKENILRHLSALCILIVLHVIMLPWGFLLLNMIPVGEEFVFFLYLAFEIAWFGFMLGSLFEYQFRRQPVFFRTLMNCSFYFTLCFLHDLLILMSLPGIGC